MNYLKHLGETYSQSVFPINSVIEIYLHFHLFILRLGVLAVLHLLWSQICVNFIDVYAYCAQLFLMENQSKLFLSFKCFLS